MYNLCYKCWCGLSSCKFRSRISVIIETGSSSSKLFIDCFHAFSPNDGVGRTDEQRDGREEGRKDGRREGMKDRKKESRKD